MELEPAVRAFVERQRVARLATNDARGAPHLVPIVFAWAGDYCYSVVDEKPKRTQRLRRIENIEADPQATLLFDVYSEQWTELAWVMLRGRLEVVANLEERERGIGALRAKYEQYAAMPLAGPLLRFTVERETHWGAVR